MTTHTSTEQNGGASPEAQGDATSKLAEITARIKSVADGLPDNIGKELVSAGAKANEGYDYLTKKAEAVIANARPFSLERTRIQTGLEKARRGEQLAIATGGSDVIKSSTQVQTTDEFVALVKAAVVREAGVNPGNIDADLRSKYAQIRDHVLAGTEAKLQDLLSACQVDLKDSSKAAELQQRLINVVVGEYAQRVNRLLDEIQTISEPGWKVRKSLGMFASSGRVHDADMDRANQVYRIVSSIEHRSLIDAANYIYGWNEDRYLTDAGVIPTTEAMNAAMRAILDESATGVNTMLSVKAAEIARAYKATSNKPRPEAEQSGVLAKLTGEYPNVDARVRALVAEGVTDPTDIHRKLIKELHPDFDPAAQTGALDYLRSVTVGLKATTPGRKA